MKVLSGCFGNAARAGWAADGGGRGGQGGRPSCRTVPRTMLCGRRLSDQALGVTQAADSCCKAHARRRLRHWEPGPGHVLHSGSGPCRAYTTSAAPREA